MDLPTRMRSGLLGGIVGDALGVPVESSPRHELSLCAVKNMLGYGRYDQPQGTWSDDTAMILCTIDSLRRGYDLNDMARTFCGWLFESKFTATGHVFDSGLTTFMALERFRSGEATVATCGCSSDDDNGNGSLMRMLPVGLFFHRLPVPEFLEKIHETSAITHAHPRSKIACGLYGLMVRELLSGVEKNQALRSAVHQAETYYSGISVFKAELIHFMRILSYQIPSLSVDEISSSGYVVDTLEAGLWCFLTQHSARDIVLTAVNLGLDTDTTGTVAGGLAGLHYGLDSIPEHWIQSLARRTEITDSINAFAEVVAKG